MSPNRSTKILNTKAAFYLWTIRNQGFLSQHIQIYIWAAVAVILVFTLAGRISLDAALQAILFGGLLICGLIWVLIERRRSWLLHIDDPALKEIAHNVMLAHLYNRLPNSHHNHYI